MITIIRDESSQDYSKVAGIADGSIEPIDISNWENLTYDEKVEAIER
ncbi:hypothetical protein RZE82_00405 [Mollicutes bacterium LVI A0039]|nr:hypothetical protein RZE82_00405 [Mollicutes bacterium LVI A0039]